MAGHALKCGLHALEMEELPGGLAGQYTGHKHKLTIVSKLWLHTTCEFGIATLVVGVTQ